MSLSATRALQPDTDDDNGARLWRLDILLPVCEHYELLLGRRLVFDGQQWMWTFRLLLWSNTHTPANASVLWHVPRDCHDRDSAVPGFLHGRVHATGGQDYWWPPCILQYRGPRGCTTIAV